MRLRDRFARFMYGRYGTDSLNKFLMWTELVLLVISLILSRFFAWGSILYYVCIVLIIVTYFRMFSKNFYARRKENDAFIRIKYKVQKFFKNLFKKKDKGVIDYEDMFRIFRCPMCGQRIRVPKGKGRIQITCPKCRGQFIKRT